MVSYTNGYTGNITLNIPDEFSSGTGISFLIYVVPNVQTSSLQLYKSGTVGSTGTEILLNNGGSTNTYVEKSVFYWSTGSGTNGTDGIQIKDSLKEGEWNLITIFNNNSNVELSVNGITSSSTRESAQGFKSFIINFGPNWILGSVALASSPDVSLPFSNNADVTSYLDISDISKPTIKGDTTKLTLGTVIKFSGTTISDVPDVEIESSTSSNGDTSKDRKSVV